jgi:hypothetical protein
MASNEPNHRANPPRITLPPSIDAIVRDHYKHPERGRLFDRLNAHSERKKGRGGTKKRKRGKEEKKGDESSVDFTFCSSGPDEGVSVRGSIGVISGDSVLVVPCRGHVIATDPDDGNAAAVILDCPEKGLIPCCCPVSLLDEATREALVAFHTRQYSGRKTRYSRVVCNVSFKSSPAIRDGVEGHLLTDAVRGLKGRVVDEAMLAALKAGCLHKGEHSSSFFDPIMESIGIKVGSPEYIRYCNGGVIRDTNRLADNTVEMLAVTVAKKYLSEVGNDTRIAINCTTNMCSPNSIINF